MTISGQPGSLGAVNLASVDSSRQDYFTAEASLRKLAGGYLRDRIDPHLGAGEWRLASLRETMRSEGPEADFEKIRLNQLAAWHSFFCRIL